MQCTHAVYCVHALHNIVYRGDYPVRYCVLREAVSVGIQYKCRLFSQYAYSTYKHCYVMYIHTYMLHNGACTVDTYISALVGVNGGMSLCCVAVICVPVGVCVRRGGIVKHTVWGTIQHRCWGMCEFLECTYICTSVSENCNNGQLFASVHSFMV